MVMHKKHNPGLGCVFLCKTDAHGAGFAGRLFLDVKAEMEHISVFHFIIRALNAEFSSFLGA